MTAIPDETGLKGAALQVQAAIRAKFGGKIREAPNFPVEHPTNFPFVMAYPASGRILWNTPEDFKGLHNIAIEVHIERDRLDLDVEQALAFAESIPNAIFDAYKDGDLPAMVTFGGEGREAFTYTFGEINWTDDIKTVGLIFTMQDVKIVTEIT